MEADYSASALWRRCIHTGKFRWCSYKRLCKFNAYPTVTSKIGGVITNCVLAWVHVIFLSDSWNSCATDNVKLMQCLNYIVGVRCRGGKCTNASDVSKLINCVNVSTNFHINVRLRTRVYIFAVIIQSIEIGVQFNLINKQPHYDIKTIHTFITGRKWCVFNHTHTFDIFLFSKIQNTK